MMKVFSSCAPCFKLSPTENNLSINELNKKIRSYALNRRIEMNACHKTSIEIAIIDNKISGETKDRIIESLNDNYSEMYKVLMGIGESTLHGRFIEDLVKGGFLNFVKEDGSLCHTAYIKEYCSKYEYYHTNCTMLDSAIVEKCGIDTVKQIEGSSIIHYLMDAHVVSAINEFISLNKLRFSICPFDNFS